MPGRARTFLAARTGSARMQRTRQLDTKSPSSFPTLRLTLMPWTPSSLPAQSGGRCSRQRRTAPTKRRRDDKVSEYCCCCAIAHCCHALPGTLTWMHGLTLALEDSHASAEVQSAVRRQAEPQASGDASSVPEAAAGPCAELVCRVRDRPAASLPHAIRGVRLFGQLITPSVVRKFPPRCSVRLAFAIVALC